MMRHVPTVLIIAAVMILLVFGGAPAWHALRTRLAPPLKRCGGLGSIGLATTQYMAGGSGMPHGSIQP
jgi:purine-cytosine permease-like protein